MLWAWGLVFASLIVFAFATIVTPKGALRELQGFYAIPHNATFDFFCYGSDDCWAVVASEPLKSRVWHLARTTNGGETWTIWKPNIPSSPLFFLDRNVGWGLSTESGKAFLAKTSDGGLTWGKLPPLPSPQHGFTGLRFLDPQNGWLFGEQPLGLSFVVRTIDGGNSAQVVSELSGKYGLSGAVAVGPGRRIWLLGNQSILYSADGGRSWKQQLDPANLPGHLRSLMIDDLYAQTNGKTIAVGEAGLGLILRSDDFGEHWPTVYISKDSTYFLSIAFWDSDHACTVGRSTWLYCTSDGGSTWTGRNVLPGPQDPKSQEDVVYSKIIFRKDGKRGWALREAGFLYQTDDGGQTWRELNLLGR